MQGEQGQPTEGTPTVLGNKLLSGSVLVVSDDAQLAPDREIAREAQPALSAAAAVRRGVTGLGRRLRLERTAAGPTALELSVLGHLHRRGPLTPGELAAAERIQPQSLTRTLTAWRRAGLMRGSPILLTAGGPCW